MGKDAITRFEVILNNSNNVYFEGQTVSGTVYLTLNAPLKARAVKLNVLGESRVHWTETGFGDDDDKSYSAKEIYLDEKFNFWGDGNTDDIPEKEHVFQFSCLLPRKIPSSYEASDGYVRYICKCKIDRPWRFDISCQALFTVNSFVDLNALLELTEPTSAEISKNPGCLCCLSGPISLTLSINRTGFVPGETIYINAEINNQSSDRITKTKAIFVMTNVFIASSDKKKVSKDITEVSQPRIDPGKSDIWNSVPLTVPSVPPSHLVGCSIIDIIYEIKFVVVIDSCSRNLTKSIPITIGTIPFRFNFDKFMHSSQSISNVTSAPFPEYPDLRSPSYAESVLGVTAGPAKDDKEQVHGKLTYTPTYAVYPSLFNNSNLA